MKRVNNPCKQKAREKRRSAAFLRKFMAVLALCMLTILAMTGCEKTSSQIEEEAMAGIRDQNLETVRTMAQDQIAPLFVQYSYEQFEMVKEQGGVVFGPLFDNDIGSRWKAFEDAHGKAVSADVDEVNEEGVIVYHLHVSEDDIGRVIGKQGKIAKAIRTVMRSAANRQNVKVQVEID